MGPRWDGPTEDDYRAAEAYFGSLVGRVASVRPGAEHLEQIPARRPWWRRVLASMRRSR